MPSKDQAIRDFLSIGYTFNGKGGIVTPYGKLVTPSLHRGKLIMGVRHLGYNHMVYLHRIIGYINFGEKIFNPKYLVVFKDKDIYNLSHDNIKLVRKKGRLKKVAKKPKKKKSTKTWVDYYKPHSRYNHEEIIQHILCYKDFKLTRKTFKITPRDLKWILTKSTHLPNGKELFPVGNLDFK